MDDGVERRLAAIFAADAEGYSRAMERDEVATLRTLNAHRGLMENLIGRHGGRIFNTAGDSVLADFASVLAAVTCALSVQDALGHANTELPPAERLRFRIGVHVGDVIVRGSDLFGEGVNIAARLQSVAAPGGVCISGIVRDHLGDKLPTVFTDAGKHTVKNIAKPLHVFQAASGDGSVERLRATEVPLAVRPAIAVLPFNNMSGDPEQDYFADGLTEDIITELSRISSLFVIARHSTFAYRGKSIDVKQIGRELNAQYVVEGSVRRVGNRVRVNAQLIEAPTGNHLWAEKYDRELADIFQVQDEITRSVVASLQTELVLGEGGSAEWPARPDFRIWDLAKRGWRKIYELTPAGIEEARRIAAELVRLDAGFARGHQLEAAAKYHLALMGFTDDTALMARDALQAIQLALRIDDRDEYSHWMLGGILGQVLGQHEKAIAAYRRALEINPNFSVVYGSLGSVLALAGRLDESIRYSEMCIRLNPRDRSIFFRYAALALAYFLKAEYTQSREWAERAVAGKREWWLGHALLAASCAFLAEDDAAHAAAQEYLAVFPHAGASQLALLPLKSGEHAELLKAGLRKAGLN